MGPPILDQRSGSTVLCVSTGHGSDSTFATATLAQILWTGEKNKRIKCIRKKRNLNLVPKGV